MCQYINVVLPADVKSCDIQSLLTKHGLGYYPFRNGFVVQQFKKDVQLINTTTKQCDCGSVIGSDRNNLSKGVRPQDIERLRDKKWSETKIKKWIADKTKTDIQAKERDQERNQWMGFLQEAIKSDKIGKIGLYIHWYDNNIFDEEITFNDKRKISITELASDTLDKLSYDTLYEFIP